VDVVPLADPVEKPVAVAEDDTLGVWVLMGVTEAGAVELGELEAILAVGDALGDRDAVELSVDDALGLADTEVHLEGVLDTTPVFDTVLDAKALALALPE